MFSVFEMGRKFGRLAHMRHIVFYQLAPTEVNWTKGLVQNGLQNTVRRCLYKANIVLPPLLACYALYVWANAEHARLQRKNPKDYENEE